MTSINTLNRRAGHRRAGNLRAGVAAVALALSAGASAQTATATEDLRHVDGPPPTRSQLVAMIENALPPFIREDNGDLVKSLMGARLGRSIAERFDPDAAVETLFGRDRPRFDPDCDRLHTASGDPDPGDCLASHGEARGDGAFEALSFSKHLGLGNVQYVNRPADSRLTPSRIRPVAMDHGEAHQRALSLLSHTLGLPTEEVPRAPEGADPLRTVMNIILTPVGPSGVGESIPIAKLVSIDRGLEVNLHDAETGAELPFVRGPGRAQVVIDDSGIGQASIRDWVQLERDPMIDPSEAFARSELVDEIADRIARDNRAQITNIDVHIAIDGELAGTTALMRPVLEVIVVNVPRDPSEAEQSRLGPTTAGMGFTVPLVLPAEARNDD